MQIYISRDGQQFGPYTTEDAQKHLRDGTLAPADLAWYEGAAEWMPLLSVLNMGSAPLPTQSNPPNIISQTESTSHLPDARSYKRNVILAISICILIGFIGFESRSSKDALLSLFFVLLILGCCNAAKKKGRHWAWGLLGPFTVRHLQIKRPNGGVLLNSEIPPYALKYLEDHKLLTPNEELIAFYDLTKKLDGSKAAIVTTQRVIYHNYRGNQSIDLSEITKIKHRKAFVGGEERVLIYGGTRNVINILLYGSARNVIHLEIKTLGGAAAFAGVLETARQSTREPAAMPLR